MSVIVKNMLVRSNATCDTYRVLDTVSAKEVGKEDALRYAVLIDTDLSKAPMPHVLPIEVLLDRLGTKVWSVVKDDMPSIDLNALTDAEQRIAEGRWKILQQALGAGVNLYDPSARSDLARRFAKEHIATRPALYSVLRLYWVFGAGKQSLVPRYRHCGSPGTPRVPPSQAKKAGRKRVTSPGRGVAITEEHRRKISRSFATTPVGKDGRSLREAYYHLLSTQYSEHTRLAPDSDVPIIERPDAVPTFEQYRYHWTRHYDLETRLRKRLRPRKFQALTRVLASGTLRDVRGPGSRYEIDATVVDAYIVSRFDPNQIIGRPTLYLVVDQFSRLIVGYYLGLEPPCWVGAMLALWCCNLDKVQLCARYGISIKPEEWPIGYMPLHLLGDRGELMSLQAEALSEGFNIDVENAPPYRGDAKGIVERSFGTLQAIFGRYIPGYVDKEFLGRGERPPQLDAVVDLDGLTRIILASIIRRNHHVIRQYVGTPEQIVEGVEFTPVALWRWGQKHLRFDGRQFTDAHLARYLWPEEKRTLSKQGLHFCRGLYFYGNVLKEQPWFVQARKESHEFSLRVHPQNLSEVLLVPNDGVGSMLRVPVARRCERFSGMTHSELVAIDKKKNSRNKAAEYENLPLETQCANIMTQETKNAKKRAKRHRDLSLSNNQRQAQIHANRQAEQVRLTMEAVGGNAYDYIDGQTADATPDEPLAIEDDAFEQLEQLIANNDPNI